MLANSSIASIQKNIKKCFDGIGKLGLLANGFTITSMISPEGEDINLYSTVKIESDIEIWLANLEKIGMK